MSLGIVIVLIVVLGYVSNWLNWRHLNYKVTHLLYYLGALVHETSHALLCIATGAKIQEFSVFSSQPHVTHGKSKLPFLGKLLISFAPIAGGMVFLFFVNRYLLRDYFAIAQFSDLQSWRDIFIQPLRFLSQINLLEWQSWVMILLFINSGAMLGPSFQDLKNVWPILILLFFVNSPFLAGVGLAATSLILINIVIQIVLIVGIKIVQAIVN